VSRRKLILSIIKELEFMIYIFVFRNTSYLDRSTDLHSTNKKEIGIKHKSSRNTIPLIKKVLLSKQFFAYRTILLNWLSYRRSRLSDTLNFKRGFVLQWKNSARLCRFSQVRSREKVYSASWGKISFSS